MKYLIKVVSNNTHGDQSIMSYQHCCEQHIGWKDSKIISWQSDNHSVPCQFSLFMARWFIARAINTAGYFKIIPYEV